MATSELKIIVTGFPQTWNDWDVFHNFFKFGYIRNVRLYNKMAFVEMMTKEGYDNLLDSVEKDKLEVNNCVLTVKANHVKVIDDPFIPHYEHHEDFFETSEMSDEKVYINEFDGARNSLNFSFWVPLHTDEDKKLEKKLEIEFKKTKRVGRLGVNSFVVVKRCEEYMRGQVIKRLNHGAYVIFFVDRGFKTAAKEEFVRPLTDEAILNVRFKAALCTLSNLSNTKTNFYNEFNNILCQNISLKGYKISLVGFEGFNSKVNIEIFCKDGRSYDLARMLAKKGVCDLVKCESLEEDKENIGSNVKVSGSYSVNRYTSEEIKNIGKNDSLILGNINKRDMNC
ncbi:RNA recognition motif domain and Tudor domain and Nucleotide-binding, alpha-beta plait domain-containing protein [Strongyloides ratti]|uniref:RNA recognition motif domain and Tudor domain and Nucleotide-binding, alpha-beta plait domain-containing protein n=1 Tax=Strongyloides ratti TaxID=34506 RepID=A0A090LMK4_STRRB|nr:RNA recognition motif domain and Tudor domain and Nucleotide-binding, alpha-beta plait domain-containing protein [Strongyloides ratti]CEF69398.1 RNA recognition motif domain and Tudor domain and Nucleotide-binding, alpha-beta plait domain-containing protein [Strongyloides ratti]